MGPGSGAGGGGEADAVVSGDGRPGSLAEGAAPGVAGWQLDSAPTVAARMRNDAVRGWGMARRQKQRWSAVKPRDVRRDARTLTRFDIG